MGTTSSTKSSFLCKPLSTTLKHSKFNIPPLDDLITLGINLTYKTELIRCNFIPKWNKLITLTGAIILDKPTFESSINGILTAMSVSLLPLNKKLYSLIQFQSSYPFINIPPEITFNNNVNTMLEAFNELCKYSKDNFEDIIETNEEYDMLFERGKELINDPKEYFYKKGYSYNEIEIMNKRYKECFIVFQNGYNCLNTICNRIKEMDVALKKYEELCNNDEMFMNRFYKIACQCKEKNIPLQKKIMFKYSNEKKITAYDDVYERESLFKKAEQYANMFLSKNTSNQLYIIQSNKENTNTNNISDNKQPKQIISSSKKFNFSSEQSITSNDLRALMKTYPPSPLTPINNINNIHLQTTSTLPSTNNLSSSYPTNIHFIHNINKLILTLSSGDILIYTYPSFDLHQTITNTHTTSIHSIIHTLPNYTMLTSSYDNALYIHVYNTTTLQYTSERLSADVEMKVNCMCDLCDGSYIAVGVNNNIGCFDYDMDNLLFSFKAHDSNVNDIVYILDKDIVISCANDKVVKVWKYNDRECICVFNEINHIINRLSVIVINNEINVIGISKEGSVVYLNMNTKEHVSNFEFADCEWIDIVNVGNIPSIITINKKGSFTLFDLKSGSYKEHNNDNNNNEFIGGFYDNTGNNILLFSSKMEYQIWSTN